MPSILKQEETERRSRNQIVLVLDPKRISRSAACTSGNFEIGTGFHFGQRFQPFEQRARKHPRDVHRFTRGVVQNQQRAYLLASCSAVKTPIRLSIRTSEHGTMATDNGTKRRRRLKLRSWERSLIPVRYLRFRSPCLWTQLANQQIISEKKQVRFKADVLPVLVLCIDQNIDLVAVMDHAP
jgi:hypothetical protein